MVMTTISKEPSGPIFKNTSGSWLLKTLFFEMSDSNHDRALYTLKTEDHTSKEDGRVYPSLRRLYLDMNDESEFDFARTYFGGWPHWKRLLQCSWFQDYLSEIREELAVRNAASCLRQLRKKASEGSLQANKYLLEQGWKKDIVGRPSKEKIRSEADRLFRSAQDVDEDLQRITDELSKETYG